MEYHRAIAIVNQISENLEKTKLKANYTFQQIKEWAFPDEFVESATSTKPMFVLKDNTQEIGVFKFGITAESLDLYFVQGVKTNNPNIKYPVNWQELILNSFILASAPVLEKDLNLKIKFKMVEEVLKDIQSGKAPSIKELKERKPQLEKELRDIKRHLVSIKTNTSLPLEEKKRLIEYFTNRIFDQVIGYNAKIEKTKKFKYSITYDTKKQFNEAKAKNIANLQNNKRIAENIIRKLNNNSAFNTEEKEVLIKDYLNDLSMTNRRLNDCINDVKWYEKYYCSINAIRDKYFDKKGYLNYNKERVKQLFKIYNENKLKKSQQKPKPKLRKLKRIKPKLHRF